MLRPYKSKFLENQNISNNRFKVSKTYQVVTPESAEIGDYDDQGFVYEDKVMSLDELRDELSQGGFTEDSGRWFSTSDEEINYTTGESTTYNLHVKDMTGKELNQETYNKIKKMAGIR